MNTLIAYASKYGSTEKCARLLAEDLAGNVDLYNLKNPKNIDFAQYDKVIIGGSIYMGRIRKEVTEFCSKNINVLKDKKLGLFICCMSDGETAEKQINDSFPAELMEKTITKDCFGGEFIFKKMNFMERFIIKKISKTDQDKSNILNENIHQFAQRMNG